MTITSITASRITDHRRNAKLFLDFATLAEEDGKLCMATLYRTAAVGHISAADRLEEQVKGTRGEPPTHSRPQGFIAAL